MQIFLVLVYIYVQKPEISFALKISLGIDAVLFKNFILFLF